MTTKPISFEKRFILIALLIASAILFYSVLVVNSTNIKEGITQTINQIVPELDQGLAQL
ncbi:hypothetical protein [Croceivirga radicis]|uniref:hypothetical protein n=1 Tax=Croceivirga radicis TaxID=1929488 RepID=UPI0002E9BE88|nr:hypothetical protein [Croceivirga radicis]